MFWLQYILYVLYSVCCMFLYYVQGVSPVCAIFQWCVFLSCSCGAGYVWCLVNMWYANGISVAVWGMYGVRAICGVCVSFIFHLCNSCFVCLECAMCVLCVVYVCSECSFYDT